jgi:hypothetical protein
LWPAEPHGKISGKGAGGLFLKPLEARIGRFF